MRYSILWSILLCTLIWGILAMMIYDVASNLQAQFGLTFSQMMGR